MADDNNPRNRPSNPLSRGPSSGAPANDPLAELARLIGQSDPFADFDRSPRPPAQGGEPRHAADSPPQPKPLPRFMADPAARFEPDPPRFAADPQHGSDPGQRYAADPGFGRSAPDLWPGEEPSSHPYAPPAVDSHGHDAAQPPLMPSYDSSADPIPRFPLEQGPLPHPPLAAEPPMPAEPAELFQHTLDGAGGLNPNRPDVLQGPDRPAFSPPVYPQEAEAGAMPAPHGDEFYDEEPPRSRRRGLLTVAAVFGLAVLGTAGAFGYRSFFGGSSGAASPPVIRASGEPSKVAPPPSRTEQTASKFSYDRFGDRGKDEQVVVREEKPVDPRDINRSSVPRTVTPSAQPSTTMRPPSGSASAGSGSASAPSALGEPRRVRTVPIRPDEPEVAANSRPSTPAPPPTPSPPPRQSAATSGSQPRSEPPSEPPAVVRAQPAREASRESVRDTVRETPPPRVAARNSPPPSAAGHAPLSLSPGSVNSAAAPAPSAPPQRIASVPTRPASPAPSAGGRYLVQVSSQRSEADAESAFRNIQSKFASVLGGQPHLIKRADLGNRGIYYRAMVGPFGSRDQAIQLCSSLKAAGGDCVVQSN